MRKYEICKMFDGNNVLENQTIVEKNGKIIWIGDTNRCPYNKCVQIKIKDGVVIPGLIDTHIHVALENYKQLDIKDDINKGYLTLVALKNLKSLLSSGVVACRDLGSINGLAISLSRAIKDNTLKDLPTIIACGKAICATGGHGKDIAIQFDGIDECIKGTRQVIKEGAECIKIMASGGVNSPGEENGPPELLQNEISSIVIEAHNRGKKVAVHAHGMTAIRRSINAGVDSIEHAVFGDEKCLDEMKKKNIFLVPTLSAPYYAVEKGLKEEPNNSDHKKSKSIIINHNRIVLKAFEKGVNIAMGTDAGCPYNPYDKAYFELILLNRIGIPIIEVLKIGTRNGANLLGLDDLGTLEVGKDATFIYYKEDVTNDINRLSGSKTIYIKGKKI